MDMLGIKRKAKNMVFQRTVHSVFYRKDFFNTYKRL